LLKHVARQLWLSNNELDQLFDCPLTAERYVEILFEKNILKK
jgi:hypothetical protein